VLGFVECRTQAVIWPVVAGCDMAEPGVFPGRRTDLHASMLVMADRGFFSHHGWRDIAGTQIIPT
jgi:hypothetical protein